MSASLVGSEMCIRDRSLTDPEYRTMARTRLATPVITSGLTCAKRRAASVSYTHLTLPTICSV
eukprot:10065987-Alexandrium_andersonii.AAC.1